MLLEDDRRSAEEPDLVRDNDRLSGLRKGLLHCRNGRVSSIEFERWEGCVSRLLYSIQSIWSMVAKWTLAWRLDAR